MFFGFFCQFAIFVLIWIDAWERSSEVSVTFCLLSCFFSCSLIFRLSQKGSGGAWEGVGGVGGRSVHRSTPLTACLCPRPHTQTNKSKQTDRDHLQALLKSHIKGSNCLLLWLGCDSSSTSDRLYLGNGRQEVKNWRYGGHWVEVALMKTRCWCWW